jgi:hypothetical protein
LRYCGAEEVGRE